MRLILIFQMNLVRWVSFEDIDSCIRINTQVFMVELFRVLIVFKLWITRDYSISCKAVTDIFRIYFQYLLARQIIDVTEMASEQCILVVTLAERYNSSYALVWEVIVLFFSNFLQVTFFDFIFLYIVSGFILLLHYKYIVKKTIMLSRKISLYFLYIYLIKRFGNKIKTLRYGKMNKIIHKINRLKYDK